jgi:tetratricopeptide (TPR) repeat protein
LTEKVKPIVEQYGSLKHRIDILSASCDMQFRRDRYVITDSILATVQEAVMLSMETGDMDTISYSRFELGFSYLWRGDFENAETELRAALEGGQRIGDLILQTRCLTYLTILYRMNAKIEQAQEYALQSLEHATAVDMVEYIGSAEANLAWSAWRQGRLAEVEQKAGRALELWSQTALVYPFQWLAIWPLIAVNLENNRIGEAIEYAQVLLEETQMHLKDELEVLLGCAINAWESNDPENTKAYLFQSTELSDQIGYL